MPVTRFTQKAIIALAPPPGRPQLVVWDEEQKGLGIVVGKHRRTFIAEGRNSAGKKRRVVLGHYPEMNVPRARAAAQRELGRVRHDGVNVNDERRARKAGPTVRVALAAHVNRMRKRQRSEASIAQIEREVEKYLGDWLDRLVADVTGEELIERYEQIKAGATARKSINPAGIALARRVITWYGACWNSLNKKLSGKLGTWNPAKAVERDIIRPNRTRIPDAELPRWRADVDTLRDPVRRDGLLFGLFSGLRDEDIRTMRWEQVDFDARALELPDPKGGESKAFKIPLSRTLAEILERRQADNATRFARAGGDAGWCFPGLVGDEVGPVRSLREARKDKVTGKRPRFPAESPHTLRRTYLSMAHEAGVSELDQHVLTNHTFGAHNVNATYIAQAFPHLMACQERIEAALLERLAGTL